VGKQIKRAWKKESRQKRNYCSTIIREYKLEIWIGNNKIISSLILKWFWIGFNTKVKYLLSLGKQKPADFRGNCKSKGRIKWL